MSRKRKPLTQIPHDSTSKRSRNNVDCTFNTIPNIRVGAILKMVLKNFMCHDLLEVPFENNVDFIIGRNGSGKSAILTALILGLGGKASLTNRGTSVKAFVKTGSNSANIKIVLNNEGPMAYKTSVYGKIIIIERNILTSGTSTYKIRSENGDVVTTKSKEISNITMNLNIQVDNPVCILNQDTARNFLSTNDPLAKYSLFNKATRLETLYNEYKQGIARWKQAEALFKEKEQVFSDLANEVEMLHQKIESHRNLQTMKDQISDLQRELLWSKVNDSEKQMEEHRQKLEEVQKKYDAAQGSTDDREKRIHDITGTIREITQKINELKEGIQQQAAPIREKMREIDELKCKLLHKNREQQSTLNEIDGCKRERVDLQKEIDNFTAKMSELEQMQLQRAREITEFQTRLKKLKELDETLRNEMYQANGDIKKSEESLHEVLHDLESTKSKYNRTKENITTLQNNSNNSLAIYGRCMFQLKEAIEKNASKFSQMPRGPLGSYITVNDKKWTLAIESYLGSQTLHSFCVNTQQDSNLLFKLMREVWDHSAKPSIITSKFFNKVHDVSNNIARGVGDCINIYEAITVKDPVVMNCLIDQNSIENILLIPQVDQAIAMMSDSRNVPRNCGLGITMKGDQFYPDPNYKMYSSKYRGVKYLQVNTTDALRNYMKSLKEHEALKNSLQSNYDQGKRDLNEKRALLRDLQLRDEKCKDMTAKARMKLVQLQSIEDTNVSNVQQLDNDLQGVNRTIEKCNLKVEEIKEEIVRIQDEIGEREQHLIKLKDARKVLELRIPPLEEQNKEQTRLRTEIDTKGEFDKRRKHEWKRRIEATGAQMEQLQRALELQIQQAEYLGQRLDELRSVPVIGEELNELQRRVRQASMMTEDSEELLQRYLQKVGLHNDMKELMRCIYEDIRDLSKAYEKRKKCYKNTRDYFENFIEHCFKKFLKMRQFKGSLKIDFKEKTLDLIVLPHLTNGITASSNLSGGERSFSTVAFLYSLWQCLDFPFYFLDEFDVFMDKANRTKVMEILIHHAKTHKSKQFVFLTPQDMPFTNDKDVTILRLEDPERRFTQ